MVLWMGETAAKVGLRSRVGEVEGACAARFLAGESPTAVSSVPLSTWGATKPGRAGRSACLLAK